MSDGDKHLSQHHRYDEDEMWCGDLPWPAERTREINEATCVPCLEAAVQYGEDARRQLHKVRRG